MLIATIFLFLGLWIFTLYKDWNRGKFKFDFFQEYIQNISAFGLAPLNVFLDYCSEDHGPFFNVDTYFSNHKILKDNYDIICKEALQLYKNDLLTPFENSKFFEFETPAQWNRFFIKWYGTNDELAKKYCPKTQKILESLPEVHMAMFSMLKAHGEIGGHRGLFRGCLRYHLGLVTPNSPQCHIIVDGENYYWKNGDDMMFDDTYAHCVNNWTNEDRIILFLDVEKKLSFFGKIVNNFFCKYIIGLISKFQN